MFQPSLRSQITKTLLCSHCIVETLNIRKYPFTGLTSRLEHSPMNGFLLQVRIEALTPDILTRSAYPGKALADAI